MNATKSRKEIADFLLHLSQGELPSEAETLAAAKHLNARLRALIIRSSQIVKKKKEEKEEKETIPDEVWQFLSRCLGDDWFTDEKRKKEFARMTDEGRITKLEYHCQSYLKDEAKKCRPLKGGKAPVGSDPNQFHWWAGGAGISPLRPAQVPVDEKGNEYEGKRGDTAVEKEDKKLDREEEALDTKGIKAEAFARYIQRRKNDRSKESQLILGLIKETLRDTAQKRLTPEGRLALKIEREKRIEDMKKNLRIEFVTIAKPRRKSAPKGR